MDDKNIYYMYLKNNLQHKKFGNEKFMFNSINILYFVDKKFI